MKIIQRGNKEYIPTYVLECPRCGCIAEFTIADIRQDKDGQYVKCPQCGQLASFRSSSIKAKEELNQD